ncbi:class I SAM-dependent methyltransferase, partial [Candidatus Pelagibacter bacterium]|nr:class I SAM-dependent methyltransferase [Candidatus Pelagibacter bacterium]
FISNFNKRSVIGVEPCKNLANLTIKKGFRIFPNYWNQTLAKKIAKKNKIDLIYSANTLSHIENLDEIFNAIDLALTENGILILEDPSLLECIKNVAYDQFYCEHLYVFSTIALERILSKFNLTIFSVENIKTHGGSNRYYIKRNNNFIYKIDSSVKKNVIKERNYGLHKISTYKSFSKKVIKSKKGLNKIFSDLDKKNKKIIGYGATAKSCTVLNYCKIQKRLIKFFYDTTSYKIGKYLPGSKIEIKKYKKLDIKNIDYVFLGAWNFKDEIFKKEKKFIQQGGKFITHIPHPKII